MVQMTAVPQRTALSHAFGALLRDAGRHGGVLSWPAPGIPAFKMSVLCCEVILGGLTVTGSLMAAGKLQEVLPQRPITFKGQNIFNLGMLAVAIGIAVYLVYNPGSDPSLSRDGGNRAGVWHHAGDPDRRRGHADGHLAVELVRRIVGCSHGFRSQQQVADHRRRTRRLFRFHPFRDHVEGDEPVVHQRSVRGLRASCSRSGGCRKRDR